MRMQPPHARRGLKAHAYPILVAAVSDASNPLWHACSLSVYRFWQDLGYALGALAARIIADTFGLAAAFWRLPSCQLI
jgi:hypothetical protein